jgi:hypothetical protein
LRQTIPWLAVDGLITAGWIVLAFSGVEFAEVLPVPLAGAILLGVAAGIYHRSTAVAGVCVGVGIVIGLVAVYAGLAHYVLTVGFD